MNIKLLNEIKYVTKGVVVFDVIILVLLLITSMFTKSMLLGLVFGSLIALLNFRLIALSLEKSIAMPVSKAQIYTTAQYILRMTITGIVLIVSAKAQHLHILGVAIGLLSPKFVILAKTLIIDKLKRKEA
ncbi:ATP synthase subunit I [Romboutsia weinsteinii]|uniref:ATP synthase subunit I n=1 Tax=Romboutsia weinsteinii TaxID=2020949 RepID=A0A371J0A4_9FIRM|nr:ATP synthase subunit I [Romboutsia weinsteinii]RDY26098.1 ATP synthase subunit I [Romboutsia weinsteinii]